MTVSEAIKTIREAKGITQSQVADVLGMEKQGYAYFEKRGDKLTVEQLKRIAAALGVTIDDILHYGEKRLDTEQVQALEAEIQEYKAALKVYRDRVNIVFDYLNQEYFRETVKPLLQSDFLDHAGRVSNLQACKAVFLRLTASVFYKLITRAFVNIFPQGKISATALYYLLMYLVADDLITADFLKSIAADLGGGLWEITPEKQKEMLEEFMPQVETETADFTRLQLLEGVHFNKS